MIYKNLPLILLLLDNLVIVLTLQSFWPNKDVGLQVVNKNSSFHFIITFLSSRDVDAKNYRKTYNPKNYVVCTFIAVTLHSLILII